MLLSQIRCHNFLCSSQPRPLWNWIMETQDITKELGLIYVVLLTVKLYIWWGKFIIVQVTLPTPSHIVPSNFMLFLKRLNLNLLNIVTLLTLRVVLWDHTARLKKMYTIFKYNGQSKPSKKQEYFCPNCICHIKTESISDYSSVLW